MQVEADGNLIVYFNGKYMPLRDAKVGILTHALHYGTGVFEGIRAHWNEDEGELYCFRMLEHFERWKRNCGILRLELPFTPEELCEATLELLRRNAFRTDVYIRPIAYKSAERVGVSADDQNSFALIALPFGDYLPSDHGIHGGVSSWRRIDDNAIPARAKICGAYVNSVLASDEVKQAGFDEAILLNESGHVAEGSTCNIFMVRGGQLITPPVTENILEGITRATMMEIAACEFHLPVIERPIDRSELFVCDELFFTGTAVGLAPVTRVNHRAVGEGAIGTVAGQLKHFYAEMVRGRSPQYHHWLAPVYGAHIEDVQNRAPLEEVHSG
jgi:branched-chain amino acid aminotransferase